MKRRLHERLHPVIGEEETDALLDQISPADPITREWLEDRFVTRTLFDQRLALIDERFDRIDERFDRMDERFDRMDERFDRMDERFGSKEWIQDRFYVKEVLDEKLEGMEHRITGAMYQALTQQTHRVYGAAGLFALIISIVDRVWG